MPQLAGRRHSSISDGCQSAFIDQPTTRRENRSITAATYDILSFRVLIERVLGGLRGQRPPEPALVERLARRFQDVPRNGWARKGGARVVRAQGEPGRALGRRDNKPADHETIALLDKLVGGRADATEKSRLEELLGLADMDLAKSRSEVGAGRYL